ncbi:hypothetical protein [Fluviicola taffensis]|uniref:Uncharacterized protein n=1 Tax=Fluviicola taffensis (strain DSM 16823 / NCIMB 13979 / RW262) TaxID=755732 RepID=F2IDK8_FLUTR|nr:hypothetical protein [Fluviicola taffensis]AEA43381.1 hypothetical protein Fluta_1387 [Fluviicola taffensis DSM 16823]
MIELEGAEGKITVVTKYYTEAGELHQSKLQVYTVEGLKADIIKVVWKSVDDPSGPVVQIDYYGRMEDGTRSGYSLKKATPDAKPTVEYLNYFFSGDINNSYNVKIKKREDAKLAQEKLDNEPWYKGTWADPDRPDYSYAPFQSGEISLQVTVTIGSTSQTVGLSLKEGGGESTLSTGLKNETVIDYTKAEIGISGGIEFQGNIRNGDNSKVTTEVGVEVSRGPYSGSVQTSSSGQQSVTIGITPSLTIPIFNKGKGVKVQTKIDETQ